MPPSKTRSVPTGRQKATPKAQLKTIKKTPRVRTMKIPSNVLSTPLTPGWNKARPELFEDTSSKLEIMPELFENRRVTRRLSLFWSKQMLSSNTDANVSLLKFKKTRPSSPTRTQSKRQASVTAMTHVRETKQKKKPNPGQVAEKDQTNKPRMSSSKKQNTRAHKESPPLKTKMTSRSGVAKENKSTKIVTRSSQSTGKDDRQQIAVRPSPKQSHGPVAKGILKAHNTTVQDVGSQKSAAKKEANSVTPTSAKNKKLEVNPNKSNLSPIVTIASLSGTSLASVASKKAAVSVKKSSQAKPVKGYTPITDKTCEESEPTCTSLRPHNEMAITTPQNRAGQTQDKENILMTSRMSLKSSSVSFAMKKVSLTSPKLDTPPNSGMKSGKKTIIKTPFKAAKVLGKNESPTGNTPQKAARILGKLIPHPQVAQNKVLTSTPLKSGRKRPAEGLPPMSEICKNVHPTNQEETIFISTKDMDVQEMNESIRMNLTMGDNSLPTELEGQDHGAATESRWWWHWACQIL